MKVEKEETEPRENLKRVLPAAFEPTCTEKPGRGWRGQERAGRHWPRAAKPSQTLQQYLGQEVLVAAGTVVESLDQQRLHVLDDEPSSRVEPRGRLALGRRSCLRRAGAGALGSLCGLLARIQTGVSQANGVSFLLGAA